MLAAGTTLGPCKILAPLGAAGTGEVLRAHGARPGRDSAPETPLFGMPTPAQRSRLRPSQAPAARPRP